MVERSDGEKESVEATGERVQKLLARAGVASRREAEEWIRQGRVTINGQRAQLGDRAQAGIDMIKVDRKVIRPRSAHRYLLLNKPKGYVTTRRDPEGRPTVLDLVPPRFRRGLFPVGRLDYDSEGLLILTTDGDLAQRVSHPSGGCTKTYEVKVKGHPDEEAIRKLRGGITLFGRQTAPSRIVSRENVRHGKRATSTTSWWQVELVEGRHRQVREMFQRIGHPVQRLRRVAIGSLTGRGVPTGACRELSEEEVALLQGQWPGRPSRPARTTRGVSRSE
jgi:23S rRNA pseudouridine2605 synthase